MIDLGISKMALIGVVALVVIGPEKLPRVARMVGAMLGKAQRYVSDVKAEVNRSMELEELQKMKASVESAAKDVESSVQSATQNFESDWEQSTSGLYEPTSDKVDIAPPFYTHPGKKWRLKRAAVPGWYKSRQRVRTHVLSGAARVARYRPRSGAGSVGMT